MTKAAKQTSSGKYHANHSKSKEDKQAREKARREKREKAVAAKAKAFKEAEENGMTWDDTIVSQAFVDDYDKAYNAATAGGPKPPETEVKGDASYAEAVVADGVKPIPLQKSMVAEAIEKAKADAATADKPIKSAQESAELFAAADKTTKKADGLAVFAEYTGKLLEQEATKVVIAAVCSLSQPLVAVPDEKVADDDQERMEGNPGAGPEQGAVEGIPTPDMEDGKATPKNDETVTPSIPDGKSRPLSKSQMKKAAKKAAQRAAQEAAKAEKAAAREAAKEANAETTDVVPSTEATASATESPTAANENEPKDESSEVPVSESQPETVAQAEPTEQPVTADESRDVAPNTKLPWYQRTAAAEAAKALERPALPPPEPKRPTQEEINAATGIEQTSTASAESAADTTTAEPTKASDDKPELILPSAKSFYGAAYDKAVDTKLLDSALFWLDKAIEKEAINGDIAKRHMELAWKTALKKEAEAFPITTKKAA